MDAADRIARPSDLADERGACLLVEHLRLYGVGIDLLGIVRYRRLVRSVERVHHCERGSRRPGECDCHLDLVSDRPRVVRKQRHKNVVTVELSGDPGGGPALAAQ